MEEENKTSVINEEEIKNENENPSLEEKKEEYKPTKKPKLDPSECHDIVISENFEETADQIEIKRRALLALFNKTKFISRILMFVVVIAVVGAIVMIFQEAMAFKIAGYSLAGAVLVAMLVYYIVSKDKFPKASKEYISNVTDLINTYDFSDKRFKDLKVYPNKKLNKTDLEVDRVYRNTSEIGSRNFITGKFDGMKFEVSENVLYIADPAKKNQRSVAFLGKYISLENNKRFEGRYIFNIKGQEADKLVDLPNDIDDLKVVYDEDGIVVYAPNEKPIKEVFGTKFLSELKEIKTDKKLLNYNLVVWAGHTGIYLSYDDSVTVLPFEHPFDKDGQNKYKDDLIKSLELVAFKK